MNRNALINEVVLGKIDVKELSSSRYSINMNSQNIEEITEFDLLIGAKTIASNYVQRSEAL